MTDSDTREVSAAPGKRRNTRAFVIETLLEAIAHSGEDGNSTKVKKMIDNLYLLGCMPITQADIDQFEWEFTRPINTGSFYLASENRLDWIKAQGLRYTVLRAYDFGMTELVFDSEEDEQRFKAEWL